MSRADVIVIGGGINGLTCAARLAGRGRKVVLLERREILGGMAAAEEFHPGHVAPGLHHESAGFRPEVAEALGLAGHGLQRDPEPPPVYLAEEDGPGLLLHFDPEKAALGIAARSAADAQAYREYRAFFGRVAALADRMFKALPPDPGHPELGALLGTGLAFRRLGERGRLELLRMGPMCVADWLNERFETPRLKAGLALPAVQGSFLGPWSPGTQTNLMLQEANRGGAVRGGAPAIVAALESAARAAGVEVRTGCDVASIDTSADGVAGVTLATGETVEARRVAASCDPKTTFLRLLSPRDISAKVGERARAYRAAGTTAKVHLALKEPLRFPGGGAAATRATTGATLDDLERAFDAAKYGEFSARPVLDILVPDSPSPTVSIVAHFAPRQLRAGWSEETRERLGDAILAELERWVPGAGAQVIAREVLTPADIEARYGTAGGHLHHGEHGIDQLAVRPFPECARYATPVPGLFLCGSGSYPGGGVTGAPGALAAGRILAG